MPPETHALLSASSAHRWLICTASPRIEETLPESTSPCAEEGRLAHEIAELKVRRQFGGFATRSYNARLKKLKNTPGYDPEMDRTTDLYIEHLRDQAMGYDSPPSVAAEVRVEYDDYVPDGYGTCDCIMIGGDTISITDYKHGKGVPVAAEGNPQMRLYALGALKRYAPIYGDTIRRIRMTIDQPRLNSLSTDEITVDELRSWGESIKPIAQQAYAGAGLPAPGEHCRFCRAKAQCRARAENNTALEDFAQCSPGGPLLTDEQVGDLLARGKHLVQWYKDLEDYATKALLEGKPITGWKLVEGRSNRAFADADAAIQAVLAAGYDEALVYDRKAKSLSELEKLMGKAEFADKLGAYVIKPPGKPTLAPEVDARPVYCPAATDFANL